MYVAPYWSNCAKFFKSRAKIISLHRLSPWNLIIKGPSISIYLYMNSYPSNSGSLSQTFFSVKIWWNSNEYVDFHENWTKESGVIILSLCAKSQLDSNINTWVYRYIHICTNVLNVISGGFRSSFKPPDTKIS